MIPGNGIQSCDHRLPLDPWVLGMPLGHVLRHERDGAEAMCQGGHVSAGQGCVSEQPTRRNGPISTHMQERHSSHIGA